MVVIIVFKLLLSLSCVLSVESKVCLFDYFIFKSKFYLFNYSDNLKNQNDSLYSHEMTSPCEQTETCRINGRFRDSQAQI